MKSAGVLVALVEYWWNLWNIGGNWWNLVEYWWKLVEYWWNREYMVKLAGVLE